MGTYKNSNLKIGLFGLYHNNANLGCAALAYSFFRVLSESLLECDRKADVTIYMWSKKKEVEYPETEYENINFKIVTFFIKEPLSMLNMLKDIKKNDIFFDFTGGDSFSDIYGANRFIKSTFIKSYVIAKNKVLVLGPQTYGPYKGKWVEKWAANVLNNSAKAFARDESSCERANKISKKEIKLSSDVAFLLPYDIDKYKVESEKVKVGINISGLLTAGGYTVNNDFNLIVNYKEYTERLIESLLAVGKYEIYLIPHVIGNRSSNHCENDLYVCDKLIEKFPSCNLSPIFKTPMDAKSFISKMDVFTGARMHSTIAAFSTGVATIPFSYGLKFEGLYGGEGYNYCISGKELSTDEAVDLTMKYIVDYEQLKEATIKPVERMKNKLKFFSDYLREIISNQD